MFFWAQSVDLQKQKKMLWDHLFQLICLPKRFAVHHKGLKTEISTRWC